MEPKDTFDRKFSPWEGELWLFRLLTMLYLSEDGTDCGRYKIFESKFNRHALLCYICS